MDRLYAMRIVCLRVLFSFFLIPTISFTVFTQSDFRPGFVITNFADTIQGYIDYRGEIRNSKICSFKKGPDSEVKEYTPLEIQAYRFTPDGKYYISKTVEIDGEEDRKLFIEHILNEVVNLCC